jgi:putative salt-induced outer membrane protein YdiY
MMQRVRSGLVVILSLFALSPAALAQDAPTQEALGRADVAAAPSDDELAWSLLAGFTHNAGNTQSWLLTAGSRFRLVRGIHAVTTEGTFNMGQAGDPLVDTSRNVNAKLRYELYMTRMDALFAAEIFRWDTFAGLDSRFQSQLGYQRHFIRADKHRLWAEAGYDLTLDNYNYERVDQIAGMSPDPDNRLRTDAIHAARVMLGYNNELNESVLLLTEVEALFNVEVPEDVRVNYLLGLRSTLAENLKAELSFTLRFDNDVPSNDIKKVDTLTQINLIYALL